LEAAALKGDEYIGQVSERRGTSGKGRGPLEDKMNSIPPDLTPMDECGTGVWCEHNGGSESRAPGMSRDSLIDICFD
jgi:hypothetical protein